MTPAGQMRAISKVSSPVCAPHSTITGAAGGVSFTSRNESTLDQGDEMPFATYFSELKRVPKLAETASKYMKASRDEELAFWMEMVLEGICSIAKGHNPTAVSEKMQVFISAKRREAVKAQV